MRLNRDRRKILREAEKSLSIVYSAIEGVCDEESEAFDNLPEGLQESERGEKMEEAISNLEDAKEYVDEARDAIQNAIDSIDEVNMGNGSRRFSPASLHLHR